MARAPSLLSEPAVSGTNMGACCGAEGKGQVTATELRAEIDQN